MKAVIQFIYLMSPLLSWTQMNNNSSTIAITGNATVSVVTDFINTGTLINQGTLRLRGDWQNLGVYDDTDGALLFDGSTEQIINNNAQIINDIHIAGGGNKIIIEDLEISGDINFQGQGGKLVIADTAQLILLQGVNIVGANKDNYIIGELFRKGTGDFYYPIGSGTEFLPVTLRDVRGLDPIVGISGFSEAPEQEIRIPDAALLTDRYWKLTSDASYTSSKIELPVDFFSIGNELLALVAQSRSENDPFTSIGGVDDEINSLLLSEGLATGVFFTVVITTDVSLPPLRVINVVTPLIDGRHDFLRIENIELYENNVVEIFTRTGAKVFSIQNYNNQDRVFIGEANEGQVRELETGTYYYTIRKGSNRLGTGFIFLKR